MGAVAVEHFEATVTLGFESLVYPRDGIRYFFAQVTRAAIIYFFGHKIIGRSVANVEHHIRSYREEVDPIGIWIGRLSRKH